MPLRQIEETRRSLSPYHISGLLVLSSSSYQPSYRATSLLTMEHSLSTPWQSIPLGHCTSQRGRPRFLETLSIQHCKTEATHCDSTLSMIHLTSIRSLNGKIVLQHHHVTHPWLRLHQLFKPCTQCVEECARTDLGTVGRQQTYTAGSENDVILFGCGELKDTS